MNFAFLFAGCTGCTGGFNNGSCNCFPFACTFPDGHRRFFFICINVDHITSIYFKILRISGIRRSSCSTHPGLRWLLCCQFLYTAYRTIFHINKIITCFFRGKHYRNNHLIRCRNLCTDTCIHCLYLIRNIYSLIIYLKIILSKWYSDCVGICIFPIPILYGYTISCCIIFAISNIFLSSVFVVNCQNQSFQRSLYITICVIHRILNRFILEFYTFYCFCLFDFEGGASVTVHVPSADSDKICLTTGKHCSYTFFVKCLCRYTLYFYRLKVTISHIITVGISIWYRFSIFCLKLHNVFAWLRWCKGKICIYTTILEWFYRSAIFNSLHALDSFDRNPNRILICVFLFRIIICQFYLVLCVFCIQHCFAVIYKYLPLIAIFIASFTVIWTPGSEFRCSFNQSGMICIINPKIIYIQYSVHNCHCILCRTFFQNQFQTLDALMFCLCKMYGKIWPLIWIPDH